MVHNSELKKKLKARNVMSFFLYIRMVIASSTRSSQTVTHSSAILAQCCWTSKLSCWTIVVLFLSNRIRTQIDQLWALHRSHCTKVMNQNTRRVTTGLNRPYVALD